jgi:hypothetical protein
MTQLGQWGRFGNQLIEYAFLRIYAREYDQELRLPYWVGCKLFGTRERPPHGRALPPYVEKYERGRLTSPAIPPTGSELCGKDFLGYAQYRTSYYRPHQAYIRQLFHPVAPVAERLNNAEQGLTESGRIHIGLHIRRGDFGRGMFYITPISWYLGWLEQHWNRFEDPVLFIAAEDRRLFWEFRRYHPTTPEFLGVDLKSRPLKGYAYLNYDYRRGEPHQMDFFPDWYLLSKCDVLVTPTSTFSFTAAMMNPNLKEFWRSHLPTQSFIQEDVWDTTPITHFLVEDYPDVAGIKCHTNPWW